jgi:hypothetical protein
MPRELRRIFLNPVDVTHAVEGFRVEKPLFLPPGKLIGVEIRPENLLVKIEMKYVDNVHLLDFQIAYDKLIEVFVAFCISRRIPLPAAGRKSTYAADGEIVFEITLADEETANSRTEWPRLGDRVA